MIKLSNVNKTFRLAKRQAGFGNAIKSLFIRKYELVHALEDVSFTIDDGEMVGYIGPNGAGKSTTMKIMCGILTPDSGVCSIDGRTPWRERVEHVRKIGVVFGQRSQLWWDIPVIDSFELIRDIYKTDKKTYKNSLDELTELLGLSELLKTPVRSLSLGQRMRCEVAASLLHIPKILFLDEPTIGLDAISKVAIRQFIKKLNAERRTTVILTTHDMQDIETLTKRILFIAKGKILFDGTLNELKKIFSKEKKFVVEYSGTTPELIKGMKFSNLADGKLKIIVDPLILSVSEAIIHLASQTEVVDVSVCDITAEEVVASLYKEYKI